jgi:hypothetical protein
VACGETLSSNLERYDRYAEENGTCGIFQLPDGVVVRHHRKEWIEELTGSFSQLEFEPFEVTTMNNNRSAAFQYLVRTGAVALVGQGYGVVALFTLNALIYAFPMKPLSG